MIFLKKRRPSVRKALTGAASFRLAHMPGPSRCRGPGSFVFADRLFPSPDAAFSARLRAIAQQALHCCLRLAQVLFDERQQEIRDHFLLFVTDQRQLAGRR